MPFPTKSTGGQDLKILVFPIGAFVIFFEIMYPITTYMELSPRGGNSASDRWHTGIVPLWKYDNFPLASWHMANVVVLSLSLCLWVWCIYRSRKI